MQLTPNFQLRSDMAHMVLHKPLHTQWKVLTKTWNDEHKNFNKTATKKSKVKWKKTIASPFLEGKQASESKHKSKKPMQKCTRPPKYKTQPVPKEIAEEPKLQEPVNRPMIWHSVSSCQPNFLSCWLLAWLLWRLFFKEETPNFEICKKWNFSAECCHVVMMYWLIFKWKPYPY